MTDAAYLNVTDERTIEQLRNSLADIPGTRGALMADNHLGYSAPIGGVMAYPDHVSPSGVGYDIGCGNLAYKTDLRAEDIKPDLKRLADTIFERIPFGVGGQSEYDASIIDDILASPDRPVSRLHQKARAQLGSTGGGNHYVDVFADEEGFVWVGVHFGSRGFGHSVASGFLNLAAGRDWDEKVREDMMGRPTLIPATSSLGESYIAAMALAGTYAAVGRMLVAHTVVEILGGAITDTVHNHHNYAWRETHYGQQYYVIRKGATPAFPGQRGFVGASMGEESVILKGLDTPGAEVLLHSTVHGAGRAMSRTAAAGKVKRRKRHGCPERDCTYVRPRGEQKPETCPRHGLTLRKYWTEEQTRKGRIDWPSVSFGLQQRGIEVRGGGADEAPGAYKRLDEVLDFHRQSIRVLHRLRPLIVAMAGPGVPADD